MKHDYKVQIVLERGDERSTWKGRGWVGVGSNPGRSFFFCFFFFTGAKMQGLYVWLCVSVLFPRIEPVGKPYREVCLQTLLWPWKVHRPSSWSLLPSELALKLKDFFFFFSFLQMAFLGCIEHTFNKWSKKKTKKVGYLWDLIQGPLNLASDALPTELRGLSLQGNS